MTKSTNLVALREFLRRPRLANGYITMGSIVAYVRKGYHMVDGEPRWTFDLANMESNRKGKGALRKLIPELREELTTNADSQAIQGIYVESVLNSRLERSLPSMGFTRIEGVFPPSFWMAIR